MRRHIKRLLNRNGAARPLPVAASTDRWGRDEDGRHDSLGTNLTNWFRSIAEGGIGTRKATRPPAYKEHEFLDTELKIPFRVIPHYKNLKEPLGNNLVRHIIRQRKHDGLFQLINRFSTVEDLSQVCMGVIGHGRDSEFAFHGDSIVEMVSGISNESHIHVGWARRTRFWPLICALTTKLVKARVFSNMLWGMEDYIDEYASQMEDREIRDLREHIRGDSFTRYWWRDKVKELFTSSDEPILLLNRLRVPIKVHNRVLRLCKALDELIAADWERTHEAAIALRQDYGFEHESACSLVIWGIKDQFMRDEMGMRLEQIQSSGGVYCYMTETVFDGRGNFAERSTEPLMKKRAELRKHAILCLQGLRSQLRSPKK